MEQCNESLKEVENILRKRNEEIDNELYECNRILDLKLNETEEMKLRVKELEEEVVGWNRRYQEEVVNCIQEL
jgi:hypothetical protein